MSDATALPQYYARLDGTAPGDPLDVIAEDVVFAIVLPGTSASGGRAELARYVRGRDVPGRRHELLTTSRDGSLELVLGVITENGTTTGAFSASAHVDANGLIDRYLVGFATTVDFPKEH